MRVAVAEQVVAAVGLDDPLEGIGKGVGIDRGKAAGAFGERLRLSCVSRISPSSACVPLKGVPAGFVGSVPACRDAPGSRHVDEVGGHADEAARIQRVDVDVGPRGRVDRVARRLRDLVPLCELNTSAIG